MIEFVNEISFENIAYKGWSDDLPFWTRKRLGGE